MLSSKGVGYAMTDQTTEMFSSYFRNRHAGGPKTNETYLALWIAYQCRGLNATGFMRSLEQEFLRNMQRLEARWAAVNRKNVFWR